MKELLQPLPSRLKLLQVAGKGLRERFLYAAQARSHQFYITATPALLQPAALSMLPTGHKNIGVGGVDDAVPNNRNPPYAKVAS
jgi:hypothetical protein